MLLGYAILGSFQQEKHAYSKYLLLGEENLICIHCLSRSTNLACHQSNLLDLPYYDEAFLSESDSTTFAGEEIYVILIFLNQSHHGCKDDIAGLAIFVFHDALSMFFFLRLIHKKLHAKVVSFGDTLQFFPRKFLDALLRLFTCNACQKNVTTILMSLLETAVACPGRCPVPFVSSRNFSRLVSTTHKVSLIRVYKILGLDFLYLDVFEIDPLLRQLTSMATYPDALVPPFRSSDDQVYHEMAPISHYNLEEAISMVFSHYRLPRLLPSPRI